MSDLESPLLKQIKQFEDAKNELKELIREANSSIKELRKEKKAIDDAKIELQNHIRKQFQDLIAPVVDKELNDFQFVVNRYTMSVQDSIYKRFDQLTNLVLYGKEHPKPNDALMHNALPPEAYPHLQKPPKQNKKD